MPISGNWYKFDQHSVDNSPDVPGVYALFDGAELINIGEAEKSIRSRLQSHLRGDDGPCTQGATTYQREECANPKARERMLLEEFARAHAGELPRCNEVMP